jgi:hypothetical protein
MDFDEPGAAKGLRAPSPPLADWGTLSYSNRGE